jgi:predicted P-loop ATPase
MMSSVVPFPDWKARLLRGDNGGLKKCMTNLMLHLRNLPGLGPEFRYNELACGVEWRGHPIRDEDYVEIRLIIESAGYTPDKSDIRAAVARLALDNSFHPVREYLGALQWDGKPRLDRWLPAIFGTPDTEYERCIGPKWLIGAVARAYEPGCKMDNMLVLEGPQDIGKSTALADLFGRQFFTEMTLDLRDHKRFVEQILGKWIVEFAELATIRKSDTEMVKAVITMQIDRAQRSYATHATEHPRQCVLAATVNPRKGAGYLSDPTGNRRFWPVRCVKVDRKLLVAARDQIWAEAVHRFRAGEEWWLDTDGSRAASTEQEARLMVDPWQDILEVKLMPTSSYTSMEVLQLLGVQPDRQTQADKNRVASIMELLGWEQKVDKDENRKSRRVWRRG